MSHATRKLVGLGSNYFQLVSAKQTAGVRIKMAVIGCIYAIAISFLLHTIATYHAACAGISSLTGASANKTDKYKKACDAAFRASINVFFAPFQRKIPAVKIIEQQGSNPPPTFAVTSPATFDSPKKPLEQTEHVSDDPVQQSISRSISPVSSLDTNLFVSSESDCSTPERSRSVPPISSPRAQKSSRDPSTAPSLQATIPKTLDVNPFDHPIKKLTEDSSSIVPDASDRWIRDEKKGDWIQVKKNQKIVKEEDGFQIIDKNNSGSDTESWSSES